VTSSPQLADLSVPDDILVGLAASRKWLPCRLLYDAHGADLFDQICNAPEYYLTRNELGLLREHLPAIATDVGRHARIIEPGSGAGIKTRMLLEALEAPTVYVPIDVCREQLEDTASTFRDELGLEVEPVHADYMKALRLPRTRTPHQRTLLFFPGSTIGNFEPLDARAFLSRFGDLAGHGALMLLGADSNDDGTALERAYDDAQGITAAFNLNILVHLNRTLGATFDLQHFAHRAVWNEAASRVEMHLVSQRRQTVRVGDVVVRFEMGEPIVTEHCYKHRPDALETLLRASGWRVRRVHVDADGRMRLWVADRA
jgi:L-histidine Nalpha-methyltransferase